MRLLFSSIDHMNADVSDEHGCIYYTISTPFGFNKATTITKHDRSGSDRVPEAMGAIEWHWWKDTVFHYNGEAIPAKAMLQKRGTWTTGRCFVAPDGKTYKWELEFTHCWMKSAESDVELVRFHRKNLGFLKPAHPAYLEVSPEVVPILDHVILTFVYIELLRQEQYVPEQRGG